jgi:hypothetical protein
MRPVHVTQANSFLTDRKVTLLLLVQAFSTRCRWSSLLSCFVLIVRLVVE